eukprot:CFRG2078T1
MVDRLREIVFGFRPSLEAVDRWRQGFKFKSAPMSAVTDASRSCMQTSDVICALTQLSGGPCAVVAPVQAHVFKMLLYDNSRTTANNDTTHNSTATYLSSGSYNREIDTPPPKRPLPPVPDESACPHVENQDEIYVNSNLMAQSIITNQNTKQDGIPQWMRVTSDAANKLLVRVICNILHQAWHSSTNGEEHPYVVCLVEGSFPSSDLNDFHDRLSCMYVYSLAELHILVEVSLRQFTEADGVLLLLYSVLLTRQPERFLEEMGDVTDNGLPLINNHGHGSISILNLFLHGRGVSHLFDGTIDMGEGFSLQGMTSQSDIGYLTVMEALHYCKVGTCLKSPRYPVWVLGSETHFTVLVSTDSTIVAPETVHGLAGRIFNMFDTEGNGFIEVDKFMPVLQMVVAQGASKSVKRTPNESLVDFNNRLVAEVQALDSSGIVLKTDFLNRIAPADPNAPTPLIPSKFNVVHCNPLVKVTGGIPSIIEGEACWINDDHPMGSDILSCLRTKWSGLRVNWNGGVIPSLI